MSEVKRYDVDGFGGGMIEIEGGAWYHMDDYEALAAEGERLRSPTPVCLCGLRTTLNPHPDAGKPEHFLKVGAVYVCIPCLNKSNHGHCKEANKLRIERDAALAELAALKGGQVPVAWAVCREPGKVDALSAAYASESAAKAHVNSYATKGCSGLHVTPLYPAPPAQASAWPEVQITSHLDELDAPVWEFINAEARKLGPLTGSIDSYGLSRPNGATPNGGIVVLWSGKKIHAVALAVRDAMNRTQCVRMLAAPAPGASDGKGGDV